MPIYDYSCSECKKNFSCFFHTVREDRDVICPFCGSIQVKKLPSLFSFHQSEKARLAMLDTSRLVGEDFYKDNRNIGIWAKRRMEQLGVKPSDQLEEVIEKARIEKIIEL